MLAQLDKRWNICNAIIDVYTIYGTSMMASGKINKLVSVVRMAEILGVSKSWLYDRLHDPDPSRRPPYYKSGRRLVRFDPDEVVSWFKERFAAGSALPRGDKET